VRREFLGVTDHFAVLGIPRAAWLDAEELKGRFLQLSALRHPDAPAGSTAAFSELNAAWQALREPAGCLRHFLELEHPESLGNIAQTPPELADLFMDIATFRQSAQKLGAKFAEATSPLAKALLEPERVALRTRLGSLEAQLGKRRELALSTLREAGSEAAPLTATLTSLVFLGKWSGQLAELRLSL
jgi:hypothetical protein